MRISAPTDFRRIAESMLPPFLFHYIDGGSYQENTLSSNCEDLQQVKLRQRVLNDMTELDFSTELFGQKLSLPLVLVPVDLT